MSDTTDVRRESASRSTEGADGFAPFGDAVRSRFAHLSRGELFEVDATQLWDSYLAAFPEGTDPIFRTRTHHDCSCCRHFVRQVGHVIALRWDGSRETVWDDDSVPYPYDEVTRRMADIVRQLPIVGVWRTKEHRYGMISNVEVRDGETRRWHHFSCEVMPRHRARMPAAASGPITTNAGTLRRGLEELSIEALREVSELISENQLYRGAEHQRAVSDFLALKVRYDQSDGAQRDAIVWLGAGNPAAHFRNSAIGSLVVDLSEGVDTERAIASYEAKVAPSNYRRPKAVITQRMVDGALATLRELGLESAIERRHARLSDVSVRDVLFVDSSARPHMRGGLEGMLASAVVPPSADLSGATDIDLAEFLRDVLPHTTELSVVPEGRHMGSLVSLTAPVHPDAGQLFRWPSGIGWSYDGDVTDSIAERVKRAGGKIDGRMRVSLAWSNTDDLDLHVDGPGGHIYYGTREGRCGGVLDVDMNVGLRLVRDPVENIVWTSRLPDGAYTAYVHSFTRREGTDVGFSLELAHGGTVQQFSYSRGLSHGERVPCLRLTVAGGVLTDVTVGRGLVGGSVPREKWGIRTETVVPVDTVLVSPNYWDGSETGNQHLFFILRGCRNPEPTRGIYNEFLKPELNQHRKVLEVLGSRARVPYAEDQMSGLGFSSTRRDSLRVLARGPARSRALCVRV